jgi:3-oxoacyl-[acyl-carrier-protein] synthase-3
MNTIFEPKLVLSTINTYRPTVISSSGIYLPKNIVKSEDLMQDLKSDANYGIPHNWMNDVIGIKERRFVDDSETPETIAIRAARNALENAPNIEASDIQKVVFCGIDKAQCEPSTAHGVASALGLNATEVYDVTDACFGFMRGVEECIRAISLDEVDHALVVTGETPSRVIKTLISQMVAGVDKATATNWIPFLTAGDAAGALILSAGDKGASHGFKKLVSRTNSTLYKKCLYRRKPNGDVEGSMKMGHLTAHGLRMYASIYDEVNSDKERLNDDHVVFHGTGNGSFNGLMKISETPEERWFKTFDWLGNITSASLPVGYHLLSESRRVVSGQRVGCAINGSGLVTAYRQYVAP